MQMMMIHGSPRKQGNSATLGKEFAKSVTGYDIYETYLQDLHLEPCKGCKWCKSNDGCIIKDPMNDMAKDVVGSEVLVFTSPVYWWGISAQLKTFIDRLYQLPQNALKNKRLYVMVTGEDGLEGIQYRLIREQFEAICEYTEMELAGYLAVCAGDDNPVKAQPQVLDQARSLFTGR